MIKNDDLIMVGFVIARICWLTNPHLGQSQAT